VGLEHGPLNLVSAIEELLRIKSSGSGLENEITAIGIRHTDHVTVTSLTSPTSSGRSAAEFARGLSPRSLVLVRHILLSAGVRLSPLGMPAIILPIIAALDNG
jgi:hypothetical protein